MKTHAILFLHALRRTIRRLEQQGRRCTWDAQTATLSWHSVAAGVGQVFLRWQAVDDLVQLALATKLCCAPGASPSEVALQLGRLAASAALPGWFVDEATGFILLRLVHFLPPGAPLDIELLLAVVAAGEQAIAGLQPQLRRAAAGLPIEDPAPTKEPLSSVSAQALFRSFIE
jgi:hypothetical protein